MSTPKTKLTKSVLATLTYSNHFDFPLTLEEIYSRLVGARSSHLFLSQILSSLLHSHQIEKHGPYYHLPNRRTLVARRLKYAQLSKPLFIRAQKLARLLSSFPTILSIFLTGSLAVNNTNGDADIDLMIITKPGRLWLTRFFLTIYTTLLGIRRTPNSYNNSGKLCLNLYLTPKSYLLTPSRHSLYTAYELIQAVPLYDPFNTHASLILTNSWIKKYLPNYALPKLSRPVSVSFKSSQEPMRSKFLEILESILFKLQFIYMKKHITREYITPDAAFFHPHDPSPKSLSHNPR